MTTSDKHGLLSSKVTSTISLNVRSTQHQEEKRIKLPFSITKFVHRYATVVLLEIFWKSILPDLKDTSIAISLTDKRFVSTQARKKVTINFPGNSECYLTVTGFSSVLISEGSPWLVSTKVVAPNIKFGSVIGELVIRPHFFYSNRFEGSDSLTVKKIEGDNLFLKRGTPDGSAKDSEVSLVDTSEE